MRKTKNNTQKIIFNILKIDYFLNEYLKWCNLTTLENVKYEQDKET